VTVAASVPGKVFKVEASVGQAVKTGDNIVILEAMKMEIPVVAPQDGTVASINVAVGDAVENGDVLATMN
jgi:biotin carboxyl carrier protein